MKQLKELVKPAPCKFCSEDIDDRLMIAHSIDFGVFGEYEISHMIAFSGNSPHIDVEIDQPNVTASIYYNKIGINYCPMCGKKLIEEEETDGEE